MALSPSSAELLKQVVYFSHINKRTQYEPPQMGPSSSSNNKEGPPRHYQQPFQQQQNNNGLTNHQKQFVNHAENGHISYSSTAAAPETAIWQQKSTKKSGGSIESPSSSSSQHSQAGAPSYNNFNTYEQRKPLGNNTTHSNGTGHYQASNVNRMPRQATDDYLRFSNNGMSQAGPSAQQELFTFTNDPNQLRGEMISTTIQKGNKGLGFTLIGNDGSNPQMEFIQIKSVIPNGPAALNGVLAPGDVLVYVNSECMLGASQDDACRVFRSIQVGEPVRIETCRGYPLLLDPANKIVTENVYCPPVTTNFQARSKENIVIDMCKGPRGFGFTITDSLQGQRVKTVLYPDQCPNLLEGDIILEIDGRNVRLLPHAQLVQMLQECPVGYRARMVVSRYVARHRSRTPTAGFRYGEQRPSNNGSSSTLVAPRSKTPAPVSSINRQSRDQVNMRQPSSWNTTIPRSSNQRDASTFAGTAQLQQQHIRPSSTSLGFSSTPNYVPISAFGGRPDYLPAGSQLITVNLIRKPDGFGFRLIGGQEMGTPLTVGAIIPGGAASLDGRLKERDEIVEIDSKPVESGRHDLAVDLIKKAAAVGHVKLVVRRIRDGIPLTATATYATNQYDYEDSASAQSQAGLLPYEVHLVKSDNEEFGCTIISHDHRFIGKILPGTPAERSGRLQAGDCVLAINAIPIYNWTHRQVLDYIKSSGNTITFTIDPANRKTSFVNGVEQTHQSMLRSEQMNMEDEEVESNTMIKASQGYTNGFTDRMSGQVLDVELSRGAKGFGFSIRGGWEFGQMPLFILRIAEDGPAAADKRLQVGDQLIEINGENTSGMSHEKAIQIIKENPVVRLLVKRPNY